MTLLAPFAFVIERKQRPPLSLSVIIKIFMLSSLVTTIHLNVYCADSAYISPKVASALSNVIPSLTFIMAVLLGMEKVKTESPGGWAKTLGTAVCVSGSLEVKNRPMINIYSTKGSTGEYRHAKDNWIRELHLFLPVMMRLADNSHLLYQAYKVYPARLSLNTLICFFASIQSSFLELCFARTPAIWKLDWNVQLLTIIYWSCDLSISLLPANLVCIGHKGPLSLLDYSQQLLLRRDFILAALGTGLIVLGLYRVLWCKRQDNSAAQKLDEGKDLADDKTLEIAINDYPIFGGILIDRGPYGFLWGRSKAEKQEILNSGSPADKSSDIEKDSKPDEGKGLADDKTLEIAINDYPLTNPDRGGRKNCAFHYRKKDTPSYQLSFEVMAKKLELKQFDS
ncbi:hypothetical protein SADUNF_Sadunf11G0110300 [Salix dunnii]|uniref:WAT1-related protein n=1 Tax=Salix dunnii TaxID=1413687 RepID=A0A835JKU5_9ROSI|nr:hypothetical protein SADUNF_Sadunf11G0110300 [Salix dunnii]